MVWPSRRSREASDGGASAPGHAGGDEEGTEVRVRPEFQFSCSSIIFDKLKLRKELKILPIKVLLGVELDRATGAVRPEVLVKDRILDGTFSFEPHARLGTVVMYRKSIDAGAAAVTLHGGLSLNGLSPMCALRGNWRGAVQGARPFAGVSYGLGDSETRLTSRGIDFALPVPVYKEFKLEVCGNVQLPLPSAQYDVAPDGSSALGLGASALKLHIAQLNPMLCL